MGTAGAVDAVGMELWIMAVLRMSLGRMGTGAVAGGQAGSAACPGGFIGSRGTVGAGAGALGALACDVPCMVKATCGAAWPAVRLGAGARTSCPPTPGSSAAWINKMQLSHHHSKHFKDLCYILTIMLTRAL